MSQFRGLLKKEFNAGKLEVFILLIVLALAIFLTLLFGNNMNPITYFIPAIFIMIFHLFYLPIYMFVSLQKESKQLHLWLHNPQSGRSLLAAKLLNALLAFIVSFTVSLIFFYYTAQKIIVFNLNPQAIFLILTFIWYSIYMTLWIIFLWVLYRVIKNKIGKFSWLIMIIIIFAGSWFMDKIKGSEFYYSLSKWGKIDIDFSSFYFNRSPSSSGLGIEIEQIPFISIGSIVYYLLLMLILFFISSWLLDKKVEV